MATVSFAEILHRHAGGLPEPAARDLVHRHAPGIDAGANRLATGSLRLSGDQGDRWMTLSTHLPPISCVRFGTPAE